MNSNQLHPNKRTLFDQQTVYKVKRSKQEDWNNRFGDGVAWNRGAIIGRGNFGCVFIAKLKNPKSRYSSYPTIMAVKSAEVSVSGSIQKEKEVMDNIRGCPNVIKCFGEETTVGDTGQMVYNLLLEYGSGGTLADVMKNYNGKGLPEFDVKRYARSIVYGLSHVHKRGYVHCDLKPENVLLVNSCSTTGGFVAKIGDLGFAKRVNRLSCEKGYWRGTPMYLSPEAVINGVQEPPADIWAVGCIVFHMLTGKPLWFSSQDSGLDEILSRICDDENDIPFVSSGMSTEAVSFLKGCLCRKVMCRLTANMLLKHPFLKGVIEDNVNEIEESHEVFDINSITSSSSFTDDEDVDADADADTDTDDDNVDDDDNLWLSYCSDESSYNSLTIYKL